MCPDPSGTGCGLHAAGTRTGDGQLQTRVRVDRAHCTPPGRRAEADRPWVTRPGLWYRLASHIVVAALPWSNTPPRARTLSCW